jgi:flavin reductase (DIM6/NTAB) family NADH-FMN oxidoreductase RutF
MDEQRWMDLEPTSDFDARALRDTFGRFATGVTIVSTVSESGEFFGLTANSFTSLSLDPPLVLFCLDYNAMSFEAFHEAGHFVVNVLSEGQEELSTHFARSSVDKWNGVDFETWTSGCPVLPGSIAVMECITAARHEGGDHLIIVGQVEQIRYDQSETKPLLYYKGQYGNIQ